MYVILWNKNIDVKETKCISLARNAMDLIRTSSRDEDGKKTEVRKPNALSCYAGNLAVRVQGGL